MISKSLTPVSYIFKFEVILRIFQCGRNCLLPSLLVKVELEKSFCHWYKPWRYMGYWNYDVLGPPSPEAIIA